jgi:NADH-quinone oxidoreductase subunit M
MTIFFGSFQHPDTFHRVATIIATSSIVITAVYILRVVGKLLLGQVREKEYLEFPDAKWYERISLVVLIVPIAMIGFYPSFLSSTVMVALNPIVERLTAML